MWAAGTSTEDHSVRSVFQYRYIVHNVHPRRSHGGAGEERIYRIEIMEKSNFVVAHGSRLDEYKNSGFTLRRKLAALNLTYSV